jgi:hypothetical protein
MQRSKLTAPEQIIRTSSTIESGALGSFFNFASSRFSPGWNNRLAANKMSK